MAHIKNLSYGAGIGLLAGAAVAVLYPRRKLLIQTANDIYDQGRKFARKEPPKSFFWEGGIAGALLGASAALMLAPRSGKNLRGQIVKSYKKAASHAEDLIDFYNQPKPKSRRKPVKKAKSQKKAKAASHA